MFEVTVDRSTWLRGEGSYYSFLKRKLDGKMCCLGAFCIAAGYTTDEIMDIKSPSMLMMYNPTENNHMHKLIAHPNSLTSSPTFATYNLMRINDQTNVLDEQRETELNAQAFALGFKFNFIDHVDTKELSVL
jgi:hypothetical protein